MKLENAIEEIKKEIACNHSSINFCQQKEDCENCEFYHENLKVSDLLPFLEELKRRRELSEKNHLSCVDKSNTKELIEEYLKKERGENE